MATYAAQLEEQVKENTLPIETQRGALRTLIRERHSGNRAAFAALKRLAGNKTIPIDLAREAQRNL